MTTDIKHRHQVYLAGAGGFIGRAIADAMTDEASIDLQKVHRQSPVEEPALNGSSWVIAAASEQPDPLRGNLAIAEENAQRVLQHRLRQVVYLSTIDVYGTPAGECLTETSPIAPETDYAIGKFAAERVIRKACRQTDTPLFILRLPGIYGPGDTSPRIIARAIRALKSDGRLTVNGDGSQQRDWVFVTDIARLIVRLTEAEPRSGLANIGTGTSHSVNHMLSLLEAAAGRPLKVDYREAPGGPPLIALDTRERQRLFPGLELTELKAGLTQTYDVF